MGIAKFAALRRMRRLDGAAAHRYHCLWKKRVNMLRDVRRGMDDSFSGRAHLSPDQRLAQISKAATGFFYAVSRTGVTGAKRPA